MVCSDSEAESEVADSVEVFLDVGGVSSGFDFLGAREHSVPATTQAAGAGGGAGCPCRTDVRLADQVVDLHGGGFAGQAGEAPAASIATSEDFALSIRKECDVDHLIFQGLYWAVPICFVAVSLAMEATYALMQQ